MVNLMTSLKLAEPRGLNTYFLHSAYDVTKPVQKPTNMEAGSPRVEALIVLATMFITAAIELLPIKRASWRSVELIISSLNG